MISHFSKAIYLTKAAVIVFGLCSPTKALDVMVLGPLSVAATAASPLVTAYSALYSCMELIIQIGQAEKIYRREDFSQNWLQTISRRTFFTTASHEVLAILRPLC